MHMFPTYIASAALLVALGALVYAESGRRYATKCYEFVRDSNKRSLTLKRLTDIEVELTEHDDSMKAILKSMHKLRSRIHSRTLMDRKTDGAPDPTTDPLDWKRYMNAQLTGQGKET